MKIRNYENRFMVCFGGVRGEDFRIRFDIFKSFNPFIRIYIDFNTENLIKIFGFNSKVIEI